MLDPVPPVTPVLSPILSGARLPLIFRPSAFPLFDPSSRAHAGDSLR